MSSDIKMYIIVCFLFQVCVRPPDFSSIIKETNFSIYFHNPNPFCRIASTRTSVLTKIQLYLQCNQPPVSYIYMYRKISLSFMKLNFCQQTLTRKALRKNILPAIIRSQMQRIYRSVTSHDINIVSVVQGSSSQ